MLPLWLVTAGAHAQGASHSPLQWLQRMGQAVRRQAYEGEVVFGSGRRLSIAHIVHRFHDGKVQERLYSLQGSGREIYRDGNMVRSIVPRRHVIFVAQGAGRGLLNGAQHKAQTRLSRYYRLRLDGTGRVAGRPCRELSALARDRYRYDYDFCLDRATALPLRIRIEARNGDVLEQVTFSRITFPASIPDRDLASHIDTSGYRRVPRPGVRASSAPARDWRITALPPGFRAVVRDRRWLPGVSRPVVHLLCTDGLATVSVFISPKHHGVPAIRGALGAFNAYATVVAGSRVTAVGEVPQATLRFISDHVVAGAGRASGRKTSGGASTRSPSG